MKTTRRIGPRVVAPVVGLLLLGLLGGCVSGPNFDDQVLAAYRTGVARGAVQAQVGVDPMVSVFRPPEGWSRQRDLNRGADLHAAVFEEEAKTVVQRVDVYWISRGTVGPLSVGGVWWDYLFYDAADHLVGYHRRFLD